MVAGFLGEEEPDAGIPPHGERAYDLDLHAGHEFAPAVETEAGGIVAHDASGRPVVVVEVDVEKCKLLEIHAETEAGEESVIAVAPLAEGVDVDAKACEGALPLVASAAGHVFRKAVTKLDGGVEMVEEIGIDGYLILLRLSMTACQGEDGVAHVELHVHPLPDGRVGILALGCCRAADGQKEPYVEIAFQVLLRFVEINLEMVFFDGADGCIEHIE